MPDAAVENHEAPHNDSVDADGARTKIKVALAFGAALITFLVYLPSLGNDFLNWDDPFYVTENPGIRSLTFETVKSAFTNIPISSWYPLTVLSFALDYALWGADPWGFHLTNAILHALNTFIVALIATHLASNRHRQGTDGTTGVTTDRGAGALVAGFVTAILFGIHPLHVESVAWVSERKDVLCALFYLSSIGAYLMYVRTPASRGTAFYIASIFFFAFSLMSKSMAVTLPVALLILDFCPLGRFKGKEGKVGPGDIARLVLEKVPFFLLSAIASLIAIWTHHGKDALGGIEKFSLAVRVLVSIRAYAFYLYKMVFPDTLAPLYPYPSSVRFLSIEYLGSLLALLAITTLCLLTWRRQRVFTAAWLYYLITLLPVIGLLQFGNFSAADRYTYLPALGPFILVAVGIGALFMRLRGRPASATPLSILVLASVAAITAILSYKTVMQTRIWKDSLTLWTHNIENYPGSPVARTNRGSVYLSEKNYELAYKDLTRAIELDREHVNAYYNRGLVYNAVDNLELSIADLTRAIELDPGLKEAHYNRATVYDRLNDHEGAIRGFTRAIELDKNYIEAYNNRGIVHGILGDYEKATYDFKRAIAIDPDDGSSHYNLAMAYSKSGDEERARVHYKLARELDGKEEAPGTQAH